VSRLLCIFPFEEAYFRKAGIPAVFVGHPLVGRVGPSVTADKFRSRLEVPSDAALIALLPGSRRKEILLNLPRMLEAARLVASGRKCFFVLPAASTIRAEWLKSLSASSGVAVSVVENSTYDAMAHSQAAIVASGTAATETALLGTPMVIVYRVSGFSWLLGRWLVHVPFFSMVNLVAGRMIVPEFIQQRFRPLEVAREVGNLLDNLMLRRFMQDNLQDFKQKLQKFSAENALSGRLGMAPERQNLDPIQRSAAIAESILNERQ
jgi:lipid-A-disaccharide synthase